MRYNWFGWYEKVPYDCKSGSRGVIHCLNTIVHMLGGWRQIYPLYFANTFLFTSYAHILCSLSTTSQTYTAFVEVNQN